MLDATPFECAQNSQPPETPANLTAKDLGIGDQIDLSWAMGFERDVLGYVVYWGTDPTNLSNSQDVGDNIFFSLKGLASGTTYYMSVSAYDVCGNESMLAPAVSEIPTWGCACPPTVNVSQPPNYAILQGTVPWTATASACSTNTVDQVEFRINGTTRYVDYDSPFEFGDFGSGWDTYYEANGAYELVAVVTDENGCEQADTIDVYVDNTGLGVSCLGIPEGEKASITGDDDEVLTITIENQSTIDVYELEAVVMDWDDPKLTLLSLSFDGSPAWTAPGFPGAASGDTIVMQPFTHTVFAEDQFDLEAVFGDIVNSPPAIDLQNTTVDLTFLGNPSSPCGPYPLTILPPLCVPNISIYSVNSPNEYDVWGVPAIGDEYYTDRNYVLTYIPSELENSILVRTPNNDKNVGGGHHLMLDFQQDVTQYIAYDPRGNPPDWIENIYTFTGLSIGVTDSGTSTLGLWKKNRTSGIKDNRGNKAAGWGGAVGTNYVIFIVCQEGAS